MKLPKELSLPEIAFVAGGQVEDDPGVSVWNVALSPLMAKEGDLALVFEPQSLRRLPECKASALLVPEGVVTKRPRIVVKRPLLALQKMLTAVCPRRFLPEPGVHLSAVVDQSAELEEGVAIGPGVVVGPETKIAAGTVVMANCVIGGRVTIGRDCLFHPGCLVADYVQVGNRVILQQGASIGADGFGYVTEKESNLERRMAGNHELSEEPNPYLKIPQVGTVILEDDVEIGSNTTVDRATLGATVIGAGTKIDNLVMIAHNCRIGKEAIIVSLTGLAGSCSVGDRTVIAGHVGMKDHINVGKDVVIEGKSGVMKDISDRQVVVGIPTAPRVEYLKQILYMKKLPELAGEVKKLKARLAELERVLTQHDRQPVSEGKHQTR